MGLRFKKSINLGAGFRINLSKSGIGLSWGFKGYRITKSATGRMRKTLSVPGTGISHITETTKNHTRRKQKQIKENTPKPSSLIPATDLHMIEPQSIDALQAADYADIFASVKRLNTILAINTLIVLITLFINPFVCLPFAIAGIWFMFTQHVRLDYEFDEIAKEKWDVQKAAWESLASCKKLWYIRATANLKSKTNAGADQGASLATAVVSKKLPWYLKSNLIPVMITLKNQKIVFMPDRLLLIEGAKLGAIKYEDIDFKFGIQPYVGDVPMPKETEIMEYRWIKTNKNGTPDKRFRDNRKLPVYKLGAIYMTSDTGLNISLLSSRIEPVEQVEKIFANL